MEIDELLKGLNSLNNKDRKDNNIFINIPLNEDKIESKEFPTIFYKESNVVECVFCDFNGKIDMYLKQGGIFVKDNPNRVNIFGCCPECSKTIISFHLTI